MNQQLSRSTGLGEGLALFGNPTRSGILVLLALLEYSYPRELARLLNLSLRTVQLAIDALEREGAVSTGLIGRTRRASLNPRYYGASILRELLLKLANGQPSLREAAASVRRRPRRRGKVL